MSSPQLPVRRAGRQTWLGVAVVAVALVLAGVILILQVDQGPRPPFLSVESAQVPPRAPPREDDILRLAGSGSNLPITRALAAAHAGQGGQRPIVHASIGSGGGVRALIDGAIDVALTSRPLSEAEKEAGLLEHPYAKVPVVVAVHSSVSDRDITQDDLLAVFRGDKTLWSDGRPVEVLMREEGDSSHLAVERSIPGFSEANAEAYRRGRWRVLYHDAAMVEALETTEGAIGLHGSGIGPGLHGYRVMAVDGVLPDSTALSTGEYPFSKMLYFVTRGEPGPEAAHFIAFAHSGVGRGIIRQYGAIPLVVDQESG